METVGALIKRGFFWSAGAFLFAVSLGVVVSVVGATLKQSEPPKTSPPSNPPKEP